MRRNGSDLGSKRAWRPCGTGRRARYRCGAGDRLAAATDTVLNAVSGLEVAEGAPDALLVIGATGAIMYANIAAETLFGYRREWLLGRQYGTVIPGRFQGHNEGIREAFESDSRMRQVD